MSATYQPRHAGALRDGDEAAAERRAEQKPLGGLAGWIDDRTGTAKGMTSQMRKVFPEHWSFMLGEIAMYSLIVCLLTGVFLTFWFVPSMTPVVYDGSYVPLQGVMVSDAYRSTLDISFDIRGGLLIRQIHHWAAPDLRRRRLRAHGPDLLHRRLPQAARDQLGLRHHPVAARLHRGLRRLLPAGRPALRHGNPGDERLRPVRSHHRLLPVVLHLRWGLPGRADHPDPVLRCTFC